MGGSGSGSLRGWEGWEGWFMVPFQAKLRV